jgi:hypothetical protein
MSTSFDQEEYDEEFRTRRCTRCGIANGKIVFGFCYAAQDLYPGYYCPDCWLHQGVSDFSIELRKEAEALGVSKLTNFSLELRKKAQALSIPKFTKPVKPVEAVKPLDPFADYKTYPADETYDVHDEPTVYEDYEGNPDYKDYVDGFKSYLNIRDRLSFRNYCTPFEPHICGLCGVRQSALVPHSPVHNLYLKNKFPFHYCAFCVNKTILPESKKYPIVHPNQKCHWCGKIADLTVVLLGDYDRNLYCRECCEAREKVLRPVFDAFLKKQNQQYQKEYAGLRAEKQQKEQEEERLRLQKERDQENHWKEFDRRQRQEKLDSQKELERQEKLRKEAERDEERRIEKERRDTQERYDQIYEQAELDHELWVYKDERLPKPFIYPTDTSRHAGTWILGNSGKGKTVLMHHLAYRDGAHTDAALLFVDNKQDFVAPLKTWARIHDRLVLIEPSNDFLLALNPLDIPRANTNHAVELIDHLLSSLVESELSGAQTLFFRNVVPALYDVFPTPTFTDLLNVIKTGLTHDQIVTLYDRCDARNDFDAYHFFENKQHGFSADTFKATRNAVAWRLDALYKASPIFKNMFNAPETKFDLGKLFDEKKVIVIDADEKHLGSEGAEFFQRYILALVYIAAQQRSGQPYKHPTFCYFDECAWIREDNRVPLILDRARSQRIGCIFAHQRLSNIESDNVLSALRACPIRYVNVDPDKFQMAKLMETSPELIDLPVGQFSASFRDQLPTTILQVPPPITWHQHGVVSANHLELTRQKARDLYCYTPAIAPRPPRPTIEKAPGSQGFSSTVRQTPVESVQKTTDAPIVPPSPKNKKRWDDYNIFCRTLTTIHHGNRGFLATPVLSPIIME